MANLVPSGDRSNFARKKIITSDSTSIKSGFCPISIIVKTRLSRIFVKWNCEMPWRNSAVISAFRARNRGSIGELSCRSRSEERRVGKGGRYGGGRLVIRKKKRGKGGGR